jgi:hypothetical protein
MVLFVVGSVRHQHEDDPQGNRRCRGQHERPAASRRFGGRCPRLATTALVGGFFQNIRVPNLGETRVQTWLAIQPDQFVTFGQLLIGGD